MIQSELIDFFKAQPNVTIDEFAQVADVYTITVHRGLAGEKLWDTSVVRIRKAFEHYGFSA